MARAGRYTATLVRTIFQTPKRQRKVMMSPRDWLERAKEWFAIKLPLLVVGVLYLGGWAVIGLLFFQLGPWGIAAAVTLFLADVALLFFARQWGVGLFVSLLSGTLTWRFVSLFDTLIWRWAKGHEWIAIGLYLIMIVIPLGLYGVIFLRSRETRKERKHPNRHTGVDGTRPPAQSCIPEKSASSRETRKEQTDESTTIETRRREGFGAPLLRGPDSGAFTRADTPDKLLSVLVLLC